jgi:phage regulator Rha-like protein
VHPAAGGRPEPLTMSTREIAELTGKRHADVLRDADKMLEELGLGERSFASSYSSEQNKELRVLNLPKRETMILVSGYSVELRARIIDRNHWNLCVDIAEDFAGRRGVDTVR